ncbi:MAG: hypothetical protein IJK67_05155 [Bacilli bacterium]|nr:hypothetical protein [Bacilli bacterium]
MNREEYVKMVKEILINKNPYGQYHKQNFDRFSAFGENAPINSAIINNIPSGNIILTEQVYEMLMAVQEATNSTGQEFPFFLYGRELPGNTVEFNQFMSASNNRQGAQASFNQTMINDLQNRLRSNNGRGMVVCHGHSHPSIGKYHQNFSLGDLTSYIQMNQDNSVFRNKQAELMGCVVTSTGDVNFVFYDNVNNNFYRFTNVYVKDKFGNLTPVSCYGLNQGQQNHHRV